MDARRREVLFAGLAAGSLALASGRSFAAGASAQDEPSSIALWPNGRTPGGPGPSGAEQVSAKGSITQVSRPRLRVYRPAVANGAAMLVIAGGGYAHIEAGTESTPACQWLQSLGVTAFELIYRLPGEGWSPAAPLQDGQRALRLIRAACASNGCDPARIGVLGFSAGGHLAGMTAATPDVLQYPAVDATDSVSSRPNFAGLIYPVLTFMPPFDHTHARREMVGQHPTPEQSAALSVDHLVTAQMPPVFLAQAKDDPISPVDNSLLMFAALRQVNVEAEMHIFQAGKHGWGLGKPGSLVHAWPGLFAAWAAYNHFFTARPA